MKLIFTLELSDEAVAALNDQGLTTQEEIADWFADTYYEGSAGYLTEAIELEDLPVLKSSTLEELYTYLHFNLRNKQ